MTLFGPIRGNPGITTKPSWDSCFTGPHDVGIAALYADTEPGLMKTPGGSRKLPNAPPGACGA